MQDRKQPDQFQQDPLRAAILQRLLSTCEATAGGPAASAAVSGEQLAAGLGVSRTTVWKHVSALRELGYQVASAPRAGYRLEDQPHSVYPWDVQARLQTSWMGREIHYYRETGSTNQLAKQAALAGAEEGLVVITDHQLQGKGRRGRAWVTPPGTALLVSVMLRPKLRPQAAASMVFLAAVCWRRAIEATCGQVVGIKWPNDLLAEGGGKIAGILTEMIAGPEQLGALVIGSGLNCNQLAADFDPSIGQKAVSLRQLAGAPVERAELLARFLEELEDEYQSFVEGSGRQRIWNEWRQASTILGREVRVQGLQDSWQGRAEDIDEDGALLVRTAGKLRRVTAADVSVRVMRG